MDGQQEQYIQGLIWLGTAAMLVLIGSIALFILWYQKKALREKKERAEEQLEYQNQMIKLEFTSQEQERKRIGADLHDSLGSLLWGAKVNAAVIQRSVELKDDVKSTHTELVQILDESIDIVRRISWELTPQAFQYAGLSESIKKMVGRLQGKGPAISFCEEGTLHWNDERALQTFRIVQELINNALKHSGASIVSISAKWSEDDLFLRVTDDGKGFQLSSEKKGIGLWNIEQRINQLKGKIKIGETSSTGGAEISITIPLLNDEKV